MSVAGPGSPARRAGFSRRDVRLMVGFGFFVEILLVYMLCVDGPVAEKARAARQLQVAQEAYRAVRETYVGQQLQVRRMAREGTGVTWLRLEQGETASLKIQQVMSAQVSGTGAELTGLSVEPVPATGSVAAFRTVLDVTGDYDAVLSVLAQLKASGWAVAVQRLGMRPNSGQVDRLDAALEMVVYVAR